MRQRRVRHELRFHLLLPVAGTASWDRIALEADSSEQGSHPQLVEKRQRLRRSAPKALTYHNLRVVYHGDVLSLAAITRRPCSDLSSNPAFGSSIMRLCSVKLS